MSVTWKFVNSCGKSYPRCTCIGPRKSCFQLDIWVYVGTILARCTLVAPYNYVKQDGPQFAQNSCLETLLLKVDKSGRRSSTSVPYQLPSNSISNIKLCQLDQLTLLAIQFNQYILVHQSPKRNNMFFLKIS